MQNNNSKTNTFLLIVLIVLVAVLLWATLFKNDDKLMSRSDDAQIPNTHTQTTQNPNGNDYQPNTNTQPTSPTTTWKYTTTPGLVVAYKSNWVAVPQSYGSPAMQAQGQSNIVGYMFTLPSSNTIIWGGNQSACSNTEFGAFVYGTSTIACVKGMRANVGVSNVRNTLPQSDIKEFGDFVTKNQ